MEAMYERVLRHARRVCPADPAVDAEDVVQAAWLKCGALLPGLATDLDRLRLWTRCVNQVALDHRRRARRHPALPLADWLPGGEDVEAEALARAECARVLPVAPPALILRGLGYGWGEIAAFLAVPQSTPRVQAHRFRQQHGELPA